MNLRIAIATLVLSAAFSGSAKEIVKTDAYRWEADTIFQGPYKAWPVSDTHITSTYSAQPHFFMPVDKEWTLKNDISSYPKLTSSNRLHRAVYNMALDEMVNAVEPDTTLRTGKEWAGVWTRDVSYSIILSMAYMQSLASEISLRHKVTPDGRIIQDTGSGGAWPVSTDRQIWTVAAWELYKVTGDKKWLGFAYPVVRRSLNDDLLTVYGEDGLVRGETSFIDWREQSYPKWMQTADIYRSEALNTNIVHAIALQCAADMAAELGKKNEAKNWTSLAETLKKRINEAFWLDDKGYYGMYLYGRDNLIMNPRAETLGESLAIIYDIAQPDRARTITESNPTTPFGTAIFYPQISDMPAYHNNALWPWVGAMWAIANSKAGNEEGTLEAIGAIVRPAALFATNKENFNLDNGDIATELNSSNMLWCLSGNLALTYRILFGINYEKDGLRLAPFVPEALADNRKLENFRYRNAVLNISVSGFGNEIKSCRINGKEAKPFIPANANGDINIDITLADNETAPLKVNRVPNAKAPISPVASLLHSPELHADGQPILNLLSWQPIEYINHYIVLRDGKHIAETTATTFAATIPGEYQVIGVADNGIESFASAPVSNLAEFFVEMPGETATLASKEISYAPKAPVDAFHGNGFLETDHSTVPISFSFSVQDDGEYALDLVYANGNGPVNTENKCAIRAISIDGKRQGITVMPHRGTGNWNDWGFSSPVFTNLSRGTHTITISLTPECENMNGKTNHAAIDRLRIKKLNK